MGYNSKHPAFSDIRTQIICIAESQSLWYISLEISLIIMDLQQIPEDFDCLIWNQVGQLEAYRLQNNMVGRCVVLKWLFRERQNNVFLKFYHSCHILIREASIGDRLLFDENVTHRLQFLSQFKKILSPSNQSWRLRVYRFQTSESYKIIFFILIAILIMLILWENGLRLVNFQQIRRSYFSFRVNDFVSGAEAPDNWFR